MYRPVKVPVDVVGQLLVDDHQAHIVGQLYTQWQVVNDKVNKYKALQTAIEEIIDGQLEYLDSDVLKQQLLDWSSKKHLSNERHQWVDRWAFDDWAASYDTSIQEEEDSLGLFRSYDQVLDKVFQCASVALEEKMISLEIGVGTGNLAGKFLNQGFEIIGLDQSKAMLYQAKTKYPQLKLRMGIFNHIPFEDDSFDRVVSTYTFHHLTDTEKEIALSEIVRVLKPGGYIVIGDMMFKNDEDREAYFKHLNTLQKELILDEYYTDISKLEKWCHSLGYQVVSEQIDPLLYLVKIYERK